MQRLSLVGLNSFQSFVFGLATPCSTILSKKSLVFTGHVARRYLNIRSPASLFVVLFLYSFSLAIFCFDLAKRRPSGVRNQVSVADLNGEIMLSSDPSSAHQIFAIPSNNSIGIYSEADAGGLVKANSEAPTQAASAFIPVVKFVFINHRPRFVGSHIQY